jgi:hypothetical protein
MWRGSPVTITWQSVPVIKTTPVPNQLPATKQQFQSLLLQSNWKWEEISRMIWSLLWTYHSFLHIMTWCAFFRQYSHLFSYMLQIYRLIRSTSQPRGVRVSGGSRAYKSSSGIFDPGETVSDGREPLNVWNLQVK